MRVDIERLQDIVEALDKILANVTAERPLHQLSELELAGVVRYFEVLGEASAGVSEELKAKTTHIPWLAMKTMRNVLIHQYFNVDTDKLEAAIALLPRFKRDIEQILET